MAVAVSQQTFDWQHYLDNNPSVANAQANWFANNQTHIGGLVKDHPERALIAWNHFAALTDAERAGVVWRTVPAAPVQTTPPATTPPATTPPATTTPNHRLTEEGGSIFDVLTQPGPLFGMPIWAHIAAAGVLYVVLTDN
jgi:hypothetical protein